VTNLDAPGNHSFSPTPQPRSQRASGQLAIDTGLLARLAQVPLVTRRPLEGSVTGGHRSQRKGFSAEFAEHRDYVAGDDTRYVDWKLYGRSDRFHLKQFEDETNFTCWLVVDTSESMSYQSSTAPVSKIDHACHAAAALAWVVLRQRDAAGLVTVADSVVDTIAPSTQPSHLDTLTRTLSTIKPSGPTRLGQALGEMARRATRPGLVICLTDAFDDLSEVASGLEQLTWRGHDVACLQIVDPAEMDFPFEEPTRFVGLENEGDQIVDPRALGSAYREEFRRFLDETAARCQSLHIDHHLLRTDDALSISLPKVLESRRSHRTRV